MPVRAAPARSGSGWLWAAAGTAAALAACAVYVRRQTKEAERTHPPQGHFIEVDGVRLHYLIHGRDDAPQTVVLLHGNGTMGEEFDISGLVQQAQARYQVIAFDRPGYGYSERPDDRSWSAQEQADLIDRALRQMGIRNPVVLGHSWGANVALAMGLRHAANVGALVLASGYYRPSLRMDAPLMSMPALPGIGTLMRHTVSPLLGRLMWPMMLKRVFAPAEPTAEFRQRYPMWMSLRPSQLQASAAESARMIPVAFSLRRHHRELAVPAVIVAGAEDRMLSTDWNSRNLKNRLPTSSLRVIEGQGHMIHHTATDQVMQAIDEAAGQARLRQLDAQAQGAAANDPGTLGLTPDRPGVPASAPMGL